MDPEELEGMAALWEWGKGARGFCCTLGLLRLLDCRACPKITATPLSHFLLSTCPVEAQKGACKVQAA